MNAEEFKSAFLPLGPMLYRIAYRMLGAEEDARDAVQELYVKLCREGDRALRSANPQGYCVRMMQNVCADILRRGGRNVLRMAADVTEVRGGPAVEAADAPVEGREEAAMVRKALAALPRKLREVVVLRDLEQMEMDEIEALGEKFDLFIGVCDSKLWLEHCSMLALGRYKKLCAVSREHRLACRERISLEDLRGETLMMVPEGDSQTNDAIRRDLRRMYPEIRLEDTPRFYDITVFNRCARTGNVLLTLECWQDVHPALVSLAVDWDYSIPYGLMYSRAPSPKVKRLVELIEAHR